MYSRLYAHIFRTALVLIATGLIWALIARLGPSHALILWSVTAALATSAGAALLRWSDVGKVSWKNNVAAYLVPWGFPFAAGRLWPLPVISCAIWIAIAVAVIAIHHPSFDGIPTVRTRPFASVILLAGWYLDGAGILVLSGILAKSFGFRSPRAVVFVLPVGILAAVIASSVVLHFSGQTVAAALLAAAPPVVVGALFGLFVTIVVVFKPSRGWH